MFFNILEANQNYTHTEDTDDFGITFTLALLKWTTLKLVRNMQSLL